MAKINCDVTNCSHNKSRICYANCVDIVGSSAKKDCDTCCGTFLNELTYANLTNNVLSSGACDCLKCTVDSCDYNRNHLCSLGDIQVGGSNVEYYTQTECQSFQAKQK